MYRSRCLGNFRECSQTAVIRVLLYFCRSFLCSPSLLSSDTTTYTPYSILDPSNVQTRHALPTPRCGPFQGAHRERPGPDAGPRHWPRKSAVPCLPSNSHLTDVGSYSKRMYSPTPARSGIPPGPGASTAAPPSLSPSRPLCGRSPMISLFTACIAILFLPVTPNYLYCTM